MKYLLFAIAAFGVIPAAFLLSGSLRLLRIAAFFIPVSALFFTQVSLNFYSHELYRGSARGMEVGGTYLCAMAILLALLLRRGRLTCKFDWGMIFALLYFCACVLSLQNADNALFSFFELWKMMMMFLVFLAVWNYLQLTGDFEVFWYGIATVLILGFPVIVRGYFAGEAQAHGVFPHQNSLGVYLVIAAPMMLAKLLDCKGTKESIFFAAAFLLAGVSTILTYSRGSIMCVPFGCAITLAIMLRWRFRIRALLLVGGMLLTAVLAIALLAPRIIERFEKAPAASGKTRINFAIAAFNMMEDCPVFGVGVNNWGIKINPPYEYSEHRDPLLGYHEDFKDGIVETVYLLAGAECGIPALLWLLLWFGFYLLAACRLLPILAKEELFYIPAGIAGGLSGAYAQSVLEWVLRQPVNFTQLMMVFAIISFLYADWKKKKSLRHREQLAEAAGI